MKARGTPTFAALVALSLATLLSALGTSSANVGLPAIARALDASFAQVQWVVLAYLLAVTTLIVSAGRLGDLMGRRRLLLGGIALFAAGSALSGAASALWLLIAARAAQGLGAACMMALTMAFVAEIVPKARTGSAMGLLGTMSAVGTALGPSLGGLLIASCGWRAVFLLNVPLAAVTFGLAYRHLPVDPVIAKSARPAFDHRGTLLLALTLTAYALAATLGRPGHFGPREVALLAMAAGGLALFVRAEARAASPLVRLAVFRDEQLSASLATSVIVSTVMMTTLVVGPFYLSRGLGLGTALVGLVLSAGPLVAAATGLPAGRIVDRFGARRAAITGLSAMAAGAFLLAVLPTSLGIPGYVGPVAILTAGYALFQTANNATVMAGVAAEQRGVTSGLLNLSRNLGLVTGASVMGAVFSLADSAAAGLQLTFLVAGALVVVALAITSGVRLVGGLGAWKFIN